MSLSVTTGFDLTDLGTTFASIETKAHKLHFLSKYGSPIMVWFGNKWQHLTVFKIKYACLFAYLPREQSKGQGSLVARPLAHLQSKQLQHGQAAQQTNMWRLSIKLEITLSLYLLNVRVCTGKATKVLLTSMMVVKKHCCQFLEGKKHKHPGN